MLFTARVAALWTLTRRGPCFMDRLGRRYATLAGLLVDGRPFASRRQAEGRRRRLPDGDRWESLVIAVAAWGDHDPGDGASTSHDMEK